MKKLPENAGSDDECEVEMTYACEKLFKKIYNVTTESN